MPRPGSDPPAVPSSLPSRRLAAAVLAAALEVPAALAGSAGERAGPEPAAEPLGESFEVSLDTEEDAERLLRLAARAAAEGKWKPCLEAYLECLRRYGGRVTREGGEDPEKYVSVAEAVGRQMAAAPREGRELWVLLKRGEFQRALARAGADPGELAQAERAYSGLPFAAEALLRAAEARYARGDVAGAVAAWLRLARTYPDGEYPAARLLARAALAAADGGLASEAGAALAALRAGSAPATVSAGGRELRVGDEVERRLAAPGPRPAGPDDASAPWSAVGGDPQRTRLAGALARPTVRRWQKALPVPPGWTVAPDPYAHMMMGREPAEKKPPPWPFPAYHPAAAGEVLYLSGDLGAMALRTHDGEPIWMLPASGGGVAVSGGLAGPALAGDRLLARQGAMALRGAFSGAGQWGAAAGSALLVADRRTGRPAYAEGLRPPASAGLAPREPRKAPAEADANVPEAGEPDPSAFAGMPLADGLRLYSALVRPATQPEYELAAFDSADGRLCWRTFLCGAAPVRTPGDLWGGGGMLLSELGQPPVLSGETVYAVSNLGALAALDAATGRVIWLRLYPRYSPEIPRAVDRFGRPVSGRSASARNEADMWEPGAPRLAGGTLYAAPQDCDYLLAVEAASGRLLWRAPRAGMRRLLGAAGDRVLLSGRDELVARSAASGKALWRRRLGGPVVGQGALGRDFAAVSTTAALEVLSLADGRPLFAYRWTEARSEAGNVLVYGEDVFTVSATHANAYCDMEKVTMGLAEQVKARPDAALPRFQIGALQFAAGKHAQAAATLAEAAARARPDERYAGQELLAAIRAKLWQCHWSLAEAAGGDRKPEAALAHLDRALAVAPDGESAARTLLARAGSLKALGRRAEAVDACQQVMADLPEAVCVQPDGSRRRAWLLAQGEVAALLAAEGAAELYARHEAAAEELQAEAAREGSAEKAEKVARLYPNSRTARQCLLVAAEAAARAGQTEAELRCLRKAVFLHGESAPGNGLRARLALAYARHGYFEAARVVAGELRARGGRLALDGGEPTCEQFLAAHPELAPPPLPSLAPPLAERWRLRLSGARLLPGCAGDAQLVFLGEGEVRAVDAASGKLAWSFPLEGAGMGGGGEGTMTRGYGWNRQGSAVEGDAVVLRSGGKMAALDRSSGRLRWKSESELGNPNPYYQQFYYRGNQQAGQDAQQNYAVGDGVMIGQETASRTDQLGVGEVSEVVRAVSIDDGKDLWTLVLDRRQVQQAARYGGQGGSGTARDLAGRLVAWRCSVEGERGEKLKAEVLVVSAPTGRILKESAIGSVRPLGLYSDRLVCQSQQGKTTAFALDGAKAWEGAGNWQVGAASAETGRLVVQTGNEWIQERNEQRTNLAGVDAGSGKLLWKASVAGYLMGGGGSISILGDRVLISGRTQSHNPWGWGGGVLQRCYLEALDAAGGKKLWQVPFLPVNAAGDQAEGRAHLACAFLRSEYRDADGKIIDTTGRNAWRGGQAQAASAKQETVLWLFDLAGGKALWEWVDPEGITVDLKQPGGAGWRRVYGGNAVGAAATRTGLLVTGADAAVLLAAEPARQPAE